MNPRSYIIESSSFDPNLCCRETATPKVVWFHWLFTCCWIDWARLTDCLLTTPPETNFDTISRSVGLVLPSLIKGELGKIIIWNSRKNWSLLFDFTDQVINTLIILVIIYQLQFLWYMISKSNDTRTTRHVHYNQILTKDCNSVMSDFWLWLPPNPTYVLNTSTEFHMCDACCNICSVKMLNDVSWLLTVVQVDVFLINYW